MASPGPGTREVQTGLQFGGGGGRGRPERTAHRERTSQAAKYQGRTEAERALIIERGEEGVQCSLPNGWIGRGF